MENIRVAGGDYNHWDSLCNAMQELLRAEMNLAYKTGDRARAQKLFERLQPDDQKK